MKTKILLLFFFSVIFLNARAQTSVYHPFPDSNAQWNIDNYVFNYGCSGPVYSHHERYSEVINGDTIIGALSYHKISIAGSVVLSWNDTCKFSGPHGFYMCSIRQDTTVKKVFVMQRGDTIEQLLYDFNLNVGDTLKGFLVGSYPPPVITNVDSVLVNGNYRKRWQWQWYYGDTGHFIEGIGATTGPLEYIMQNFDAPETRLLCFKQDNVVLFIDTTIVTDCNIIDAINNPIEKNLSISISPNPLTTSSILQFNTQLTNTELIIYNILGKEIMRKTFSGNEVQVEKGNMESGVYFVKVRAGEKEWVEKILVE